MDNNDGAYVIQEQGDLGLGLTPIDEKYIKNKDKSSDKDRERK